MLCVENTEGLLRLCLDNGRMILEPRKSFLQNCRCGYRQRSNALLHSLMDYLQEQVTEDTMDPPPTNHLSAILPVSNKRLGAEIDKINAYVPQSHFNTVLMNFRFASQTPWTFIER